MFVGSFKDSFPEDIKKDAVFCGRSNVGKSSLINALFNQKIARVSKSPGATSLINFYNYKKKLYIVDTPGYGYARKSKEERDIWKELTSNYFNSRKGFIKKVFVLIDRNSLITELDELLIDWVMGFGLDIFLLITKVDTLTQKEKDIVNKKMENVSLPFLLISSKEKIGINNLISIIEKL